VYTSVRNAPEVPPGDGDQAVAEQAAETAPRTSRRRRITGQVGGTVIAMGAVSFLTDASAEMVTAVLPLFLILQVGLTPLQYGVVDGVYQGATVLVRLVGGYLADRWRRPKIVCTVGYGLSAVTKLGLLGVGSAASTSFVLAVDRAGKGIRTAPRDAVIAAASRPALLGRAFGVHRTLDTAGAMLGPLLAFLVLLAVPGGYHPVFVVSFGVAVLGVAVLVLFVPDIRWKAYSMPLAFSTTSKAAEILPAAATVCAARPSALPAPSPRRRCRAGRTGLRGPHPCPPRRAGRRPWLSLLPWTPSLRSD